MRRRSWRWQSQLALSSLCGLREAKLDLGAIGHNAGISARAQGTQWTERETGADCGGRRCGQEGGAQVMARGRRADQGRGPGDAWKGEEGTNIKACKKEAHWQRALARRSEEWEAKLEPNIINHSDGISVWEM
ncbi:unnamed protein product [Prorocentrum cordatum]|uniref:Uncharacterized protein n=1 Tax=Prorocentrum cordatum TaxID=2364126 RepID=A0ABN9RKQ8_9DINO|nr:unnamed protein product [Polarella glacialis]